MRYWWLGILLILGGCTALYEKAFDDAANNYKHLTATDINSFKKMLDDIANNPDYPNSTIYAFVCNNSKIPLWKRYWYFLISGFNRQYLFDPPLLGGKCWIENVSDLGSRDKILLMANLTEREIQENPNFWNLDKLAPDQYIKKRYERVYTFGLASGPTFADFNNLNPYCNSSLRYSIKFVRGTEERYIIPVAPEKRAACYLDLSVIPTYVFHGMGRVPRLDNGWELARTLYKRGSMQYEGDGIGPVILVTEASLNKTTFFQYPVYKDGSRGGETNANLALMQAYNFKQECPTCLVALYVPLGINASNVVLDNDGNVVDDPQNDLNWLYHKIQSDEELKKSIDIIATGWDVRELDNPCDWNEMLRRFNTILDFAQSLGKMTYVIYTYYPLEDPDPDDPTKTVPSCRTYKEAQATGQLASSADMLFYYFFRVGALGNSLYNNMVSKGLMAISMPPLYVLSGKLNFGRCDNCSLIINNVPNQPMFSYVLDFCQNYGTAGYTFPIIYNDNPNDVLSASIGMRSAYYTGNVSNFTTILEPPKLYTLSDKEEPLFMCTGCFLMLDQDTLNYYKNEFDLSTYETSCNEPEEVINKLKIYGEILDVDLPFLRALIEATSNYNKCYVSLVEKSRQVEKCSYELTWTQLEDYINSNGISCDVSDYKDWKYDSESDSCSSDATGEECVPCGLGIMDVKGVIPGSDAVCGTYDPFDIESNLCEGMSKLAEALDKARELLSENINLFFPDVDGEGAVTDNVNYTILYMLMGAIYYDGEGASLEKAVEWYEKAKYWDPDNYGSDAIIDDICGLDNPYGICGPNVSFWKFLKGLEEAGDNSGNREIQLVAKRTKIGLIVMSKYFDAYGKCKDCYNDDWSRNIDRRLCQVNPELCRR